MTTDLQSFSRTLFAAANRLWTNSALRPDQYAQPVLALIALRQMEAKFEVVNVNWLPNIKGRLKPAPADYQAKGAIFLPESARFSRLLALPKKSRMLLRTYARLGAVLQIKFATLHADISERAESSGRGQTQSFRQHRAWA
jgi:type I restriction-modification system DNA methylase subunit